MLLIDKIWQYAEAQRALTRTYTQEKWIPCEYITILFIFGLLRYDENIVGVIV